MSREAMQIALEALESDPISHAGLVSRKQAITALSQALEEKHDYVIDCPRCGHCCQSEHIKTWYERCEEHPDHQTGIITERMIQERMQEEIDELRQALETKREWVGLTDKDLEALFLNEDGVRFARYIESRLKDKNA